MSKDKTPTPAKTHASKIAIISTCFRLYEKTNLATTSEQMDVDPLETIKTHNI